MILRAALLWLLCATVAAAQNAPTAEEMARRAAADLAAAARVLEASTGAPDRVATLTQAVRAYEDGLSALRDGLRQVARQDREIGAQLDARKAEIGRLVTALQVIGRAPGPQLLLHPDGPVGTARASMILSDMAPVLNRDADRLRDDLAALQRLRLLQEAVADSLTEGLSGVQEARAALSDAITERTPRPGPFAEDPNRIAALLARSDTLRSFADGLGTLPTTRAQPLVRPLPLPVAGQVLHGFGAEDAAGIARPGMVLATAPGALVTAPAAGTIRYAGPLLDYGNVIILEPQPGTMLVFAGLSGLYGQQGEIVEAAAALGLMGGRLPDAVDFMRDAVAGGGALAAETLYVEVREAGRPVDPATWFAADELGKRE